MALLEVRGVRAGYGDIEALHGIDLDVAEGELVALLGTNGAGKTTTLRTISSLVRARAGEISFTGRRIDNLTAREIARLGIVHVPEGRHVFPGLTVHDNLVLGASNRGKVAKAVLQADIERQLDNFPDLKQHMNRLGWTLSGGQQQMVAIARGLMGAPRLLLIDEASLGLAPIVVRQVFEAIRMIREQGTTVMLVEQNATMALSVADRAYIIDTGVIGGQGSAEELLCDDAVSHAYLGRSRDTAEPA